MFGRVANGITTPKALEGKNVGVPGLNSSSVVYGRAILQEIYGVDTSKINWEVKPEPQL